MNNEDFTLAAAAIDDEGVSWPLVVTTPATDDVGDTSVFLKGSHLVVLRKVGVRARENLFVKYDDDIFSLCLASLLLLTTSSSSSFFDFVRRPLSPPLRIRRRLDDVKRLFRNEENMEFFFFDFDFTGFELTFNLAFRAVLLT